MAKRFTDTEQWDKEWFMQLSCRLKCLVQFVRSKCDLSGVWSPNWLITNSYIGEQVCEQDLLGIDDGKQFYKLENGKIFCIGFINFQYGELSEKSPVHRKILLLLEKNNIHKSYKNIGCLYPINRVQEEEEDKEEEEVKVKEEEKAKKTDSQTLISSMSNEFMKFNADYPADESKDYPALLKIAKFIGKKIDKPFNLDEDFKLAMMPYWSHLCKKIPEDNFYKNYSLSQIEKHIQNIIQTLQNGNNNSKPNSTITADGLRKAHAKYFGTE